MPRSLTPDKRFLKIDMTGVEVLSAGRPVALATQAILMVYAE